MQNFEISGKIINAEGGAAVPVQLILEAEVDKVTGKSQDLIHIDLAIEAYPRIVDEKLVNFLSSKLQISSSKIAVASGSSLQKKIVIIMGLTPQEIEKRLSAE